MIAGLIGIVIVPWKLLDMYQTWLISYSGLLGAVAGVMICDYVVVRHMRLDTDELYRRDGEYSYRRGVNSRAIVALVAGLATALLGRVVPGLSFLFSGAWFSATLVSFFVYWLFNRRPREESK